MDLYFQGRAWWNRGLTLNFMIQARDFFERAIALDPGNVEAMVGLALVDVSTVAALMTDDWSVRLATAEATSTKVLSLVPNHALAHLALGLCPNDYETRNPGHRRMRARVGAGSQFCCRA